VREWTRLENDGQKGHKKGHENVPFWVLDGFVEISATLLERMAGTTRLELATSAVTATTWKSTDGTVSHWKYIIDNAIVYRHVYRGSQPRMARLICWSVMVALHPSLPEAVR